MCLLTNLLAVMHPTSLFTLAVRSVLRQFCFARCSLYRVSVNLLVYNCVTLSLWAAYGFLQSVTPWTNLQIHASPPLWAHQDISPPPSLDGKNFLHGGRHQKSCFFIFFLCTVVYNYVTLGCLWFFLI